MISDGWNFQYLLTFIMKIFTFCSVFRCHFGNVFLSNILYNLFTSFSLIGTLDNIYYIIVIVPGKMIYTIICWFRRSKLLNESLLVRLILNG